MHEIRVGLFLALLMLFGCEKKSQPTVVIDSWWMLSRAQVVCKQANVDCPDPNDPGNVLEYIDSLKAQFAASPTCHGVSVFDYRGPRFVIPEGMPTDNNREQLIIDYQPSQPVQTFSIMGKPSNNVSGTGTVEQIVKRTCAAARGLGGKVQ